MRDFLDAKAYTPSTFFDEGTVENQKDGRRQSNFVDRPSDSVKLRNLGRVVVDGSLAHWSSQTLPQS